MEILKESDMKLLSRKRVQLLVHNTKATPSRKELLAQVAEKFKVKPEFVVIKHIYPQYGKNVTKLIVHIYSDKDKMEIFEHSNLLKKHSDKPAEQPAEG